MPNLKRRIEITTVTEQAVLVRPVSLRSWRWCAGCGAEANLVTPDQAATIVRVYMRTIFQWVESGKLHFEETADGKLLVCMASLAAMTVTPDPAETMDVSNTPDIWWKPEAPTEMPAGQ
jgi:hypothetical protein